MARSCSVAGQKGAASQKPPLTCRPTRLPRGAGTDTHARSPVQARAYHPPLAFPTKQGQRKDTGTTSEGVRFGRENRPSGGHYCPRIYTVDTLGSLVRAAMSPHRRANLDERGGMPPRRALRRPSPRLPAAAAVDAGPSRRRPTQRRPDAAQKAPPLPSRLCLSEFVGAFLGSRGLALCLFRGCRAPELLHDRLDGCLGFGRRRLRRRRG